MEQFEALAAVHDPNEARAFPAEVLRVKRVAAQVDFRESCADAVGWLLRALAATAQHTVLEIGTGVGVGTAWLASGARSDIEVVSVEIDQERALIAAGFFSGHENVRIVNGSFDAVRETGPFGVIFVDAPDLKDSADLLLPALAPGGIVVLDGFAPPWQDPDADEQQRRDYWTRHPGFVTTEILTTDRASVVLAVKR